MAQEAFLPAEGSDEFPSEEDCPQEASWTNAGLDEKRVAAILKNPHFVRRKKRIHSASFSHPATGPLDPNALSRTLQKTHISSTRCLYGKNSRRSRDGKRQTKKRVGKNLDDPTDVLDEIVIDHDDPDYDSDQEPTTFEPLSPAPSDDEFEKNFIATLNEFFGHGRTDEVITILNGLNLAPHQRRRIPYLAVTLALQRKATECELTSELLSDLCGKILTEAHIQQGFAMVLNELGELSIDYPKAADQIGRFIARALLDDILPPKFIDFQKRALVQSPTVPVHKNHSATTTSPPSSASLTNQINQSCFEGSSSLISDTGIRPRATSRNLSDSTNGNSTISTDPVVNTSQSSGIGSTSSLGVHGVTSPQLALSALVKAENWLNLSHIFARLDNIWGVPAGPRGTEQLSKKIHEILQYYFESQSTHEVMEALSDLDSPHFLHELVFQAVVMAIEISTDDARASVVRLLGELCRAVVITQMQLELGIKRVYSELPDLQLDVPLAYVLLDRFLKAGVEAGFVSKELSSQMPPKPRKRFISETDSVYRRNVESRPLL